MTETEAFYTRIGESIRANRMRKKLSQANLAFAVGFTRTSISNIEKGRQKLLLHTFWEIAQALEVEPGQLLPPRQPSTEKELGALLPRNLPPNVRTFIEAGIGIKKRR